VKLTRVEANWIASKLLSDAERERERSAERRTAWLTTVFPPLKFVRPTERLSLLQGVRSRAAREPIIVLPSVAGLRLFAALYIGIPKRRPVWLNVLPAAIIVGNLLPSNARNTARSSPSGGNRTLECLLARF
jgi:hypothetical protein